MQITWKCAWTLEGGGLVMDNIQHRPAGCAVDRNRAEL